MESSRERGDASPWWLIAIDMLCQIRKQIDKIKKELNALRWIIGMNAALIENIAHLLIFFNDLGIIHGQKGKDAGTDKRDPVL